MRRREIARDISRCMVFATANGGNDEVQSVIATLSLEYSSNNLLLGGSGIIDGAPADANNLAAFGADVDHSLIA